MTRSGCFIEGIEMWEFFEVYLLVFENVGFLILCLRVFLEGMLGGRRFLVWVNRISCGDRLRESFCMSSLFEVIICFFLFL